MNKIGGLKKLIPKLSNLAQHPWHSGDTLPLPGAAITTHPSTALLSKKV